MPISAQDRNAVLSTLGLADIRIWFQPIVSVKTRSVIGVEALARGVGSAEGDIVSPGEFFHRAVEIGVTAELDRLCRATALESFRAIETLYPGQLLFVNVDTSTIEQSGIGAERLNGLAAMLRLNPSNIVLEINETRSRDTHSLHRFVESEREHGFLIALDDVGAGHSNLGRIPLLRPDILKIDRSLITGLDAEYYQQVVFGGVVAMARRTGTLVVAEGIEDEADGVRALELGADALQGFYFSKATPDGLRGWPACRKPMARIAAQYERRMIDRVRSLRSRRAESETLLSAIRADLCAHDRDSFDRQLWRMLRLSPAIECLYVLSAAGIQVTETVCGLTAYTRGNSLYRPAHRGTDHSHKEYYYLLTGTGVDPFSTEPYLSLASGGLCVTHSTVFHDRHGEEHILCVDLNPD